MIRFSSQPLTDADTVCLQYLMEWVGVHMGNMHHFAQQKNSTMCI